VEPHVLIVSTKVDIATDAVVKALAHRSARCSRLNSENFPFDSTLTTRIDSGSSHPSISFAKKNDHAKSLDDVSSLWYRRIRSAEAPDDMERGVYDFCVREANDALLGMLQSLPVPVMSAPHRIWAAEHKPYQLTIAKHVGLSIPETIITNDPAEVRQAFHRFRGRMIAKPIRSGVINTGSEERAIYTSLVLEEHLSDLESARWSPAIYQVLIPKACDVRVTIVGDKFFVAEIDSQGDPAARIDWRRTDNPHLPHRRGSLPNELIEGLKSLMARLNLEFGCVDLVRTPMDDYFFLEINPNGQWLWLDDKLGFGISDSIAAWLTKLPK
jgi:glutathione synthase/RimK-type ligase-like ATP-grasp enzyme